MFSCPWNSPHGWGLLLLVLWWDHLLLTESLCWGRTVCISLCVPPLCETQPLPAALWLVQVFIAHLTSLWFITAFPYTCAKIILAAPKGDYQVKQVLRVSVKYELNNKPSHPRAPLQPPVVLLLPFSAFSHLVTPQMCSGACLQLHGTGMRRRWNMQDVL